MPHHQPYNLCQQFLSFHSRSFGNRMTCLVFCTPLRGRCLGGSSWSSGSQGGCVWGSPAPCSSTESSGCNGHCLCPVVFLCIFKKRLSIILHIYIHWMRSPYRITTYMGGAYMIILSCDLTQKKAPIFSHNSYKN